MEQQSLGLVAWRGDLKSNQRYIFCLVESEGVDHLQVS
jgi:hypothetical protein